MIFEANQFFDKQRAKQEEGELARSDASLGVGEAAVVGHGGTVDGSAPVDSGSGVGTAFAEAGVGIGTIIVPAARAGVGQARRAGGGSRGRRAQGH
jgi:hypothetical protein